MVDAKAVRDKLSKQLLIDLEDETVHVQPTSLLVGYDNLEEDEQQRALDDIPTDEPCQTQIRELGEFLAKITLAGGHTVPLRINVLKR